MDDLGYKFVEVVKLIHEEGVLLVGVCGDVLQLILGCPGDADGVGDHTWITGGDRKLHTQALRVFVTANGKSQHTRCVTPRCGLTHQV